MHIDGVRDFDKIIQRIDAWYHCEIIDRPPVGMSVRTGARPDLPRKSHETLRERWLDVEYSVDLFEASVKSAIWMGDSFPIYWPNVGPDLCATVFGCELEFGHSTSWSIPVAKNCRDILNIKPSLDNVYWNTIRQMTDLSLERGQGKWITCLADFHTNGDLVAALRDPQELAFDMADDPEGVRLAVDYVTESYPLMYNDLCDRIVAKGQPPSIWGAPFNGRIYVTNCDFICMISPKMFEDTILPALQWEMNWLDRNHFHLDGPGALTHLDRLLELPELYGIQWVYGAGQGPASAWLDVYKKIQAAGKCMEVITEGIDDARAIMQNLRPEGVWLHGVAVDSVEEGEGFLREVELWAKGR